VTHSDPNESPLHAAERVLAESSRAILHSVEEVLRLPEPAASRWHRAGVSERGERVFNVLSGFLLILLTAGWTWSIATTTGGATDDDDSGDVPVPSIASALTATDAPSTAYLTDAAVRLVDSWRGSSGRLRARVEQPGDTLASDTLPAGAALTFSTGAVVESTTATPVAPSATGVWRTAVRVGSLLKPITDLSVITLTPFSKKRRGRIGLYYLGSWPTEGNRVVRKGYVTPNGFIEVTPENQHTPVSDHFELRDFLTHDQANVWPKYLVLDLRLVDKLELVLADLESRGHDVSGVTVMSGFRTPQYNTGGGDPRGRADLSRHMYGDAADIFIDSDGNGRMDDLNRDGRITMRDSEIIQKAVDRIERTQPELIGGAGVYPGTSGHGPFIHIDVRGYRARWIGTGDS
jgi:uncharacterized protein YcbK (DUF882 family)